MFISAEEGSPELCATISKTKKKKLWEERFKSPVKKPNPPRPQGSLPIISTQEGAL